MHFNTLVCMIYQCHVMFHDIDICDGMEIMHVSLLFIFTRFHVLCVMNMHVMHSIMFPSSFLCFFTHIHIYIMYVLSIFMISIYAMWWKSCIRHSLLLFMLFYTSYVMYMHVLVFISYPCYSLCFLTLIHVYIIYVISTFMISVYAMWWKLCILRFCYFLCCFIYHMSCICIWCIPSCSHLLSYAF